jgi:hypothetical protein
VMSWQSGLRRTVGVNEEAKKGPEELAVLCSSRPGEQRVRRTMNHKKRVGYKPEWRENHRLCEERSAKVCWWSRSKSAELINAWWE